MDDFEDTKEVIFDEREEMLMEEGGSGSAPGGKTKVIDSATNMTEVDMSFEIEEIEVRLSQVLACTIYSVEQFVFLYHTSNL